jgi:predicted permease
VSGDLLELWAIRQTSGRRDLRRALWRDIASIVGARLRRPAMAPSPHEPRVSASRILGVPHMWHDLRYACRVIRRQPAFAAVVLVSLALGIGANSALFTAVNGLLLEKVAVPDPDALVRVKSAGPNDMVRSSSDYGFNAPDAGRRVRSTVSFAIFQALRAANQTMTDLTAFAPRGGLNVFADGQADFATGLEASGNYFHTLEVNASHGRVFTEDDDRLDATPVVVLSDPYWQHRFHGDPSVIHRVISVNNQRMTIVGITPPEFVGVQQLNGQPPDLTMPLAFDAAVTTQTRMNEPTSWWLLLMGRRKPGVTVEHVQGNLDGPFRAAARAGMAAYTAGLSAADRQLSSNRQRGTAVPALSVSSGARGTYDLNTTSAQSAEFLSVVVSIVLLIVCANVANLLLSRATARQREISIRLSMGATRARLVRQLLTESLLLSGLGGACGVVVGYWGRALLPFGQSAPVNWHVFAFVAGLSVLTGIAFGLLPALRTTRVDLADSMKEGGRSVTGTRSLLAKGLLIVQVALSLLLLVGAGLFLRTLDNLRHVDVGFNPTNLLEFGLRPQLNGYDATRVANLYDELVDRLSTIPGVRSAATTQMTLTSGGESSSTVWAEGHPGDKPAEPDMFVMTVSPEFFKTMEIPILTGRGFTNHDTLTSPKVVLINETAARRLFPGDNPLGHHVGFSLEDNAALEIVGILRDTKYNSIRDAVPPTMYSCSRQGSQGSMQFVVRTAADPNIVSDAVRSTVRQVDSTLPLTNFTTQADQLEKRFAQERLFATAYSLFGGLALLLACIGLFGLMSYNVSRRTSEIGIRMALGAKRGAVVRMVLAESFLLVGLGSACGLASSVAAGRLVKAVLFGLAPTDPVTLMSALALVLLVAAFAAYLPARRASLVDPMVALRQQ